MRPGGGGGPALAHAFAAVDGAASRPPGRGPQRTHPRKGVLGRLGGSLSPCRGVPLGPYGGSLSPCRGVLLGPFGRRF